MHMFEKDTFNKLTEVVLYPVIGIMIGILAWGRYSSPAVALILIPILALAPTRLKAVLLALGYQLCVARGMPVFTAGWLDSWTLGIGSWLGVSLIATLGWTLAWVKARSAFGAARNAFLGILITLLPPVAMVMPGHPLIGMGFLFPGSGWFGVAIVVVVLPLLCGLLFNLGKKRSYGVIPASAVVISVATVLIGFAGVKLNIKDITRGRVAGNIAAINTTWGGFPDDDVESILRVERIGQASKMLAEVAPGESPLLGLVFPEAIIGYYEPGIHAVIVKEILKGASAANQVIILGAEIQRGLSILDKAAVIFYPDGSSNYVLARQPVPLAEWRPWSPTRSHYPNWSLNSTASVGNGVRARFVFCYEEYIPVLHLLSEATDSVNLVIALANRGSAGKTDLQYAVQSGSTQGMALLFGRKWLRADNSQLPNQAP
jgi:hypothetical protein